jgi:hypothetical protein
VQVSRPDTAPVGTVGAVEQHGLCLYVTRLAHGLCPPVGNACRGGFCMALSHLKKRGIASGWPNSRDFHGEFRGVPDLRNLSGYAFTLCRGLSSNDICRIWHIAWPMFWQYLGFSCIMMLYMLYLYLGQHPKPMTK